MGVSGVRSASVPHVDSDRVDATILEAAVHSVDSARLYAKTAARILKEKLGLNSDAEQVNETLEVLVEIGFKLNACLNSLPDSTHTTDSKTENPQYVWQSVDAINNNLLKAQHAAINTQWSIDEAGCISWFEDDIQFLNDFTFLMVELRKRVSEIYKQAMLQSINGSVPYPSKALN